MGINMSRKNAYTENVDKVAGMRIHELRLAQGLSRKQLAKKIGVTHQQLQKYEIASNRISFGRLCLIAKVLGKPIAYFSDDADSDMETIASQHQRMAIEISCNFMRIKSVSNQYAVNQMVKILAENK